jgi:DNA-binding HxlR family transcriptional regulator
MARIRSSPRQDPPEQDCPLERCLQILSGAWTAKILWYLRAGPRRFGDLRRDLGSISAKILTTRLRELEEHQIVARAVQPTRPPTVEYSLTEGGKLLHPVLDAMVAVGKKLDAASGRRQIQSGP